jgi:hypothetical protein
MFASRGLPNLVVAYGLGFPARSQVRQATVSAVARRVYHILARRLQMSDFSVPNPQAGAITISINLQSPPTDSSFKGSDTHKLEHLLKKLERLLQQLQEQQARQADENQGSQEPEDEMDEVLEKIEQLTKDIKAAKGNKK